MKEENTVTRNLDSEVLFDGKLVKKIKFDLEHINRGWDQNKNDYNPKERTHYTEEDIIEFFEQFGYVNIEWDNDSKTVEEVKGKKYHRYVAYVTDHKDDKQKKIVVDIPFDFKNEGVVVTVY